MAIQKQINYQVNFQANTINVQNALTNLQNSLRTIQATPIAFDSTGLVTAKQNAQELQVILQKATNINTGKLDISKFSQQLKTSGKDLATYANSLKQLGSQGQQAFMQLAQSIGQAHVPIRTTNKLLNSLWINLKNVTKWQISSNLLMGFTSGISNAVQYTKDLNKNLNDIRIVSGQSADQMERFAEKANKAAKPLSTSTKEYTKAALIYYQQGLNEQQVQERTDATIKMANVTGESADDVSSYMTAIWNNFDDGSKSLEYYADVMTALGAATASSTDEIATGLEKFAGIAETVGLSYEYATSALATLVAETRQSPETVGTALKTIFSRLQGLKLGETLEDGTNLNKYSEALATVGVNIKNSNGTLKDMDLILEELASKWNLIGKDQQMALAQTVGGVRQYTQLITLMDNWGDMQKNLDVAYGSEGELNKQAEIYAESWEAASERTRASLEKLYSDLVPEDFLIDFTNTMGGFVDAIDGVVEGIGGLGPILIMTLGMVASRLMPQILQGGQNIVNNMAIALGFGEKQTQNFIQQSQEILKKEGFLKSEDAIYKQMAENVQKILQLRNYELENANSLTKARKEEIDAQIEQLNNENNLLAAIKRRNQETKTQAQNAILTGSQYAMSQGYDVNIANKALKNYGQDVAFGTYLSNFGFDVDSNITPLGSLSEKDNSENRANARNFIKGQGELASKSFEASYGITTDNYLNQIKERNSLQNEINKKRANIENLNNRRGKDGTLNPQAAAQIQQESKALAELTKRYQGLGGPLDDITRSRAVLAKKIQNLLKVAEEEGWDVKKLQEEYDRLTKEINQNTEARTQNTSAAATDLNGTEAVNRMTDAKSTEANNNAPFVGQNEEPDPQQTFNEAKAEQADGYRQAVQGVTSALSGAYMAIQSIQSLGSIWSNDDLTTGEKLLSTLMSISMIIPGITSAWGGYKSMMEGLAKAQKKKQIIDEIQPKLEKAKQNAMKKTEAQEDVNQADDKADMAQDLIGGIAESFKQAGPLGAIIGGAIALAIGGIAVAGIAGAISKAKSQNAQEEIDKYQEAKQESAEKQSSYSTFKQEYEKWKRTGEVTDELKKSAEEAGEAFDIVETSTLVLTKNFDSLNKQIEALAEQDLKTIIGKGDSSERASLYLLQQSILKGQGHKSGGNLVDTMRSSGNTGDVKIARMVNQGDYKYLKTNSSGDLSYNVDLNDPKVLLGLIEEFNTLSNQAVSILSTDELKNANLYTKLQNQLYENKDLVGTAETLENTIDETDLRKLEYFYKYENKETTSEKMSQAEYEKFRTNMIEWAEEQEIDEKNVLKFLTDINQEQEAIATSKDNQLKIMNWDKKDLDALWSDEFSLGIKVYPNMTEEAYQEALKQAQNIADTDKNYLIIKAKVGALKDLDKLSPQEFQEKYLTPGKSEYLQINAEVFYSWSKKEQEEFLKQETGGADVSALINSATSMISGVQNIDVLNAQLNEANKTKKDYEEDSGDVKSSLEQLEKNLNTIAEKQTEIAQNEAQIEKEAIDFAVATAGTTALGFLGTVTGGSAWAAATLPMLEMAQSAQAIDSLSVNNRGLQKDIENAQSNIEAGYETIQKDLLAEGTYFKSWFNKKLSDDEKTQFAEDAKYRKTVLAEYIKEAEQVSQAAQEAQEAYDNNLKNINTKLNEFTKNSLISLDQTENLEQTLKVLSQINSITQEYENTLEKINKQGTLKEQLGISNNEEKIYNKTIQKLKEFKNTIPGVSNEISDLENILANPKESDSLLNGFNSVEEEIDSYINKILAATEATEHFSKFTNLSGSINSDIKLISRDPNGLYIETQQSFANIEKWLSDTWGINTDTATLQAKWQEFSNILNNTAGKTIAEIQQDLNNLFNGENDTNLLKQQLEELGMEANTAKEIIGDIADMDFSTPDGLKDLEDSLKDVKSVSQQIALLMAALPGLVPKSLTTKYNFITQAIDGTVTSDIVTGQKVLSKETADFIITQIEEGKINRYTKDEFRNMFEAEDGELKVTSSGDLIIKDDFLIGGSKKSKYSYSDRIKGIITTLQSTLEQDTETVKEEIAAVLKQAGLLFSENINTAFNSTTKNFDLSEVEKRYETEESIRLTGAIEDLQKEREEQQLIIDSNIASEEDIQSAIKKTIELYKTEISTLKDRAKEYKSSAQDIMNSIFASTIGDYNLNTKIGVDSKGNELTLDILGDELLDGLFKDLKITKDTELTNEQRQVINYRLEKKRDEIERAQKEAEAEIIKNYGDNLSDAQKENRTKAIESNSEYYKNILNGLDWLETSIKNYSQWSDQAAQDDSGRIKRQNEIIENIKQENDLLRNQIELRKSELNLEQALLEIALETGENLEEVGKQLAQNSIDRFDQASKDLETYTQEYTSLLEAGANEVTLRAKMSEIISAQIGRVEALKEVYETINIVLEKANEQIENQISKLEAITEIADSYISILETLGERFDIGKIAQPEALQKLQQASLDMSIKNVKVVKDQRDAQIQVVAELDKALALMEEGSAQYNQLLITRNMEASKLVDLETQLVSTMREGIEKATELFEANIDKIIQTLSDALSGNILNSLDELDTAYERAEKAQERYLSIEKQGYELSKLRRSINQQINSNTSQAANIKLQDILKDINKIESEHLKMSEYDLQMLNAKYELYKAQIALEEAQNNKSQIRLQRNASGNWSYVFTADQGKIDAAAQKVEDAQYNIYSQSEEYLKEIQKNIITLNKEWTEALKEIYDDSSLTEEERKAAINRTNSYFASQLQYYTSELDKSLDITGLKFSDTNLSIQTGIMDLEELQSLTTESILSNLENMEQETEKYEQVVDNAMEAAGGDLQTFGDTVAEMADPNNKDSLISNFNTIASSIETMCSKIVNALQPVLDMLSSLTGIDLNMEIPQIEEENNSKYDSNYAETIEGYKQQYDNEEDPNVRREIIYAAQRENKLRNQKIKDLGLTEKQVTDEEIKNWFEGKGPKPFDTGGYTGEWGSEGKLAVLHQKELVLNEDDTQKILDAVEIARMIAGNALGQMGSLANAFSLASYQSNLQTLQQEVHIEATFPGVQSAFEIETALKNIVNDVSQYAEMPNKFN